MTIVNKQGEVSVAFGTPLHRLQEVTAESGFVWAGDVADVCKLLPGDDKVVAALKKASAGPVGVQINVKADDIRHLTELLILAAN